MKKRHVWMAIVALAVAGAAVGAHLLATGALQLPARYNPWAPLAVADAPNALTPFKLRRARADRNGCLAALATSGARFESTLDRDLGGGCGFDNAVRLRAGATLALAPELLLSCRTALSFAMWERHALQPAARERLGRPLVSLQHLGSYACRNVNSGEGDAGRGRRSRHATADALDISAFTLSGGRRISVAKDWHARQPERAEEASASAFLREARDGACRWFDGVLGPDYNRLHADHFHLEVGGWRSCR